MNYSTLALLVNKEVKTVGVTFYEGNYNKSYNNGEGPAEKKVYVYKTLFKHEIGDIAVVLVNKFPKTVRIAELNPEADKESQSYKWIVDVVDMKAYEHTLEIEDELIKKIRTAEQSHKRKQILAVLGITNKAIKGISFKQGE